jgi:hypothetical protein
MCVFVIEVNWQISATVKNTRPSDISLKCRSSRPLAELERLGGHTAAAGDHRPVALHLEDRGRAQDRSVRPSLLAQAAQHPGVAP